MLADSAVENRTAAAGDVPWPLLQIGGAVGCAHDWQSFGGLPVVGVDAVDLGTIRVTAAR